MEEGEGTTISYLHREMDTTGGIEATTISETTTASTSGYAYISALQEATVAVEDLLDIPIPQVRPTVIDVESISISEEVVPKLVETAFDSDTKLRFSGASWFKNIPLIPVLVGGVGGIGSFVAFYLARMGTAAHIYDFDAVESVNLAGQLFTKSCIGMSKVDAAYRVCGGLAPDNKLSTHRERITGTTILPEIVFSCFDNMETRKLLFENWLTSKSDKEDSKLFIDGRLSAEAYQVFVIPFTDKKRIEIYKSKYLFDDSEADATVCSYKQTTHMAAMISSRMVAYYTNFLHNLTNEDKRQLPFLDEFDNQDFYFKITM